jgi:hypothetical protein
MGQDEKWCWFCEQPIKDGEDFIKGANRHDGKPRYAHVPPCPITATLSHEEYTKRLNESWEDRMKRELGITGEHRWSCPWRSPDEAWFHETVYIDCRRMNLKPHIHDSILKLNEWGCFLGAEKMGDMRMLTELRGYVARRHDLDRLRRLWIRRILQALFKLGYTLDDVCERFRWIRREDAENILKEESKPLAISGRFSPLTPSIQKEVLALREKGMSIRKIAEKTGIAKSVIGRFLKGK